MGITHLWDTNSVIYYLQQQFSPSAEKFIDTLLTKSHPSISAITEIELLCWKAATEKDLLVLQNFIQDIVVFELDRPIKLKAADLRKLTRLKLPDAIIAATALVFDLTLLTRNIQDFENISELKIVNPWNQ
jgi:predicted nucleic acid-binding protein